jgi:hypothetical protein
MSILVKVPKFLEEVQNLEVWLSTDVVDGKLDWDNFFRKSEMMEINVCNHFKHSLCLFQIEIWFLTHLPTYKKYHKKFWDNAQVERTFNIKRVSHLSFQLVQKKGFIEIHK